MGFWVKREKTRFVEDEAGNVQVERSGDVELDSDRFIRQAKMEKKQARQLQRKAEREAYNKSFNEARIARMKQKGKIAGGTTFSDRLGGFSAPNMRKGKPYRISNNYNPFGSMFDSGINYKQPSKPKSGSTKYKVIGGKAYPVAGSSKKKSRKGKRKARSVFGGYDIADNWGFL